MNNRKFYNNSNHTLPCTNYIISGTCVYNHKCQYIHDSRCQCTNKFFTRGKKNSKSEFLDFSADNDIFYWPEIHNNCNIYNMNSFNSQYNIREYSIWSHFINFLLNYDGSPFYIKNIYTNNNRLPIFVNMSLGNSVYFENNYKDNYYIVESPRSVIEENWFY